METFIKIIINTSLIFGSGYCAKELLYNVEKMATKRVEKGLSSSEGFCSKTHWHKAVFLMV